MSFVSKLFSRKQRPGTSLGDAEWNAVLESAASAIRAGKLEEAIELYTVFIGRKPTHADAYYKRAVTYNSTGRLELALADYDRAIAINPEYGYAYCNRGSVLERLGRKEDAVGSYDKAVSLNPEDFLAHYNRGTVLKQLGRLQGALNSFDRAIQLNPAYAEAYVNRGNVLQELWRHEDAITSFDKAIDLNPIFAEAFQGRGTSLQHLKRLQPAIDSFTGALALNPQQKFVAGMRRYLKMQVCDWSGLEADLQQLAMDSQRGIPVCSPFAMLSLFDSPALHKAAAELWVRTECASNGAIRPIARGNSSSKIKIGYFSPDFRNHPVAQSTAELFEHHDRAHFEVIAFSFGPPTRDEMRVRLEQCFDRFIDVNDRTDLEVSALARQLEIDVAIDLGGLTEHCRTNIFAMRAAPVQINFLGYPGTMGAEFIDYVVADRTVIPESNLQHFAEKVIFLPDFYLPSDSIRPPPMSPFSRQQLGLPDRGFVFCCFNHVGKLMPSIFESWMRTLKRVDGSVLWLAHTNPVATDRLLREAAQHGVLPERLIFADRIDSLAEHRARLGHADLFLDTIPYNAHVTALDALWAGLPILTLAGEAFAGRVAASLLNVIGLQELIATTPQQYEELAALLGNNPERISEIRTRLLRNRAATRAFDIRRFAANLEAAYEQALDRYSRGQPPDHIYLES